MDVAAGVECENPRSVIRGWKSHNVQTEGLPDPPAGVYRHTIPPAVMGIHWLRGSLPKAEKPWAEGFLNLMFETPETPAENEWGFWNYDRHIAWPNGAMLLYHSTPKGEEYTKGRFAIEVPGHVLDQFDVADVMIMFAALSDHDFQCSRLDLYFDDFERSITPRQIEALVYEVSLGGNQPIREDWTGFRDLHPKHQFKRGKGCVREEIAFGARGKQGSGKYLRVYDKSMESQGRNPAIRWELELSDKRAKKAFEMLLGTLCDDWKPEVTAGLIGALIGECIDFKVRNGRRNVKRCPRYAFWQRIIDRIGCQPMLREKDPPKSIERAERWLWKQIRPTLQMVRAALGTEEFLPMLFDWAESDDKITPKHQAAIDDYLARKRGAVGLNIAEVRALCDKVKLELEGDDIPPPTLPTLFGD